MSPLAGSAVKANFAVSVVLVLAGGLLCSAAFLLLHSGPLLQTAWVGPASLVVPGVLAVLLALAPLTLAAFFPNPRPAQTESIECEETETFAFRVTPPTGKRYVALDAFARDLGLGLGPGQTPDDERDAPDAIQRYDAYIQSAALFKK